MNQSGQIVVQDKIKGSSKTVYRFLGGIIFTIN
jgi:hypothetical protein